MNGYKIKFNGIDRLYDNYSWRLTRRAKKVWQSGNVLLGPELKKLEKKFCKKYKRKYAVGVGSATDGLYFSMKALGLNKSSTVTCPTLSYVATSGSIKRLGAKINFVDVDTIGNIGNLNLYPKPDAILYVNLYGNMADYDRLKNYCDENKVYLIEDAAQSQGAYIGNWYKKSPSGTLGDVSVFSFDPMKNLPCFGSGGMVLTDSVQAYENLISLRRHGLHNNMNYGYNSVIPEDHAAQLNFLLDKFESLQDMREHIAKRYFKNLSGEQFIKCKKHTISSHHKIVLLHEKRDELQQYLKKHGVETKVHYPTTLHKAGLSLYPNAEKISKQALSLPIYPYLTDGEVDYVCQHIKKFNGTKDKKSLWHLIV